MNKKLFDQIDANTTLLTPNRRLAAALLKQFHQLQNQQNKHWWPSLDVLPLPSWLQRLWQTFSQTHLDTLPLLLTPNQEKILWETILRASPASENLLQITATAEFAKSAWELLKLWQVEIDHPEFSLSEDSHVFQQWALEFQQQCEENNWLDTGSLAEFIYHQLQAQEIILPKKIILVGFTEISPLHQSLLNACEKLGTQILHVNADKPAATMQKIGLSNEETEVRMMARWAKHLYETTSEKKPYLIGCVIPRLESMRDEILQIFNDTFSENHTFTYDHSTLPFNISAGKSLTSFPVIHTALELLKLHNQRLTVDQLSSLLRTPFIGEAEHEQLRRAQFDSRLRNANIAAVSLQELTAANEIYSLETTCPALAKRIQHYLDYCSPLKKTLPISQWIKIFIDILTIFGWPGERSLNSPEYQVTRRWLDLLTEYTTFDAVLSPQKFSSALDYLAQLSAKTIFQPQTPEAPIQILGILEAAELPFEHLWVMGLDDTSWPSAAKPNPFIPLKLQKSLHMPHASAERELLYCERMTEQLKNSANHVVFSYPLKTKESDLRPSALLNSVDEAQLDSLQFSDTTTPAELIYSSRQMETIIDELAPPITENDTIRGGTHIFKQQAACPFKAFAELRLHARWLETPTLGLRAIDRGNIVHTALELIWQQMNNSTYLADLSDSDRQTLIHSCAQQAINQHTQSINQNNINQRYLLLEQQRLEKLLSEWMQLEIQRPHFKVLMQEHEISGTIGKIPIKLRIDRIDELADGGHLIIDYKTGKYNEVKNWFGIRPDEPQLPLYCIMHSDKTVGISFGQIHPDNMALIGVSERNIDIHSIKLLPETSYAQTHLWSQQLYEWQTTLENLGNDFCSGIAKVDPKDINKTCNHCKLQTFCRIYEKP